MGKCTAIRNVYWITLFLVWSGIVGCGEAPSDETRLRRAIATMEKAAEAKEVRPIMAMLADEFVGNKTYRKANIAGLLLLHFRQNQHIHVYVRVLELTLKGQQATLRCQVVLAGRDEPVIPKQGRVLVIDSDWQKRDGEWRVVKASWQDVFTQS